MAKRFRSRRRFRRAKREYIWVTSFGSSVLDSPTGPAEGAVLVSKADWARDPSAAGHLEKGCVLIRTIVDLAVMYPPPGDELASLGDASAQWFAWVRKLDEDDTTVPNVTTDGLDEEFMHFESGFIQSAGSSVATLTWRDRTHAQSNRHWDITAKRKLTSEELVRIEFAALGPLGNEPGLSVLESQAGILFGYSARCLLQLP